MKDTKKFILAIVLLLLIALIPNVIPAQAMIIRQNSSANNSRRRNYSVKLLSLDNANQHVTINEESACRQ